MNRKLFTFICMLMSGLMIFALSYCKKPQNSNNSSLSNATYVNLDINPEIELIVDKDNKVVSVYGVNEDGKVLLFGEDGIVGKKIDEAVQKITDLAVELGYLTEDNKVITTTISSDIKTKITEVEQIIKTKVDEVSKKCGFEIKTDNGGSFSISRKFDSFKAKYPNNQLIQALTIDEFRLALSASETGEISLEAAVEYDKDQLINLINDYRKEAEEFATETYNKAKAQALLIYDETVNAVIDGVYAGFYAEKITSYPSNFWYGYAYQSYKTISRGLNSVATLMSFDEKVSEYPLNQDQIQEILNILKIDSSKIEDLKNSDGEITVNSVEAYVDRLVKNAVDSQSIKDLKQQLTDVLNGIDGEIVEKIKSSDEEEVYWENIEDIPGQKIFNDMDSMLKLFLEDKLSEQFLVKESREWINL